MEASLARLTSLVSTDGLLTQLPRCGIVDLMKPPHFESYGGVHHWLLLHRGRASEYACTACGKQARDWAYDHEDPDARYDMYDGVFSPDPDHYLPFCRSCHKWFDKGKWYLIPVSTDRHRLPAHSGRV